MDLKRSAGCLVFAGLLLTACSTVPMTGRKQLALVPQSEMIAQADKSYRKVVEQGPLSADRDATKQIRRVGKRISTAVDDYLRTHGQKDLADQMHWEFNLIEKDEPNAWCMPGGKVVFYTGILPYTKDDAGVASVMGHEIAHAIAGHSAERVSQQLLLQGGALAVAGLTKDSKYRNAYVMAYGLGGNLGAILPYSRLHESEADRIGLILMAMAGYDPHAAVAFWERMAADKKGAPPEFLSTHPSDAKRIRRLREELPEALKYYHPAGSDSLRADR